LPELAAELVARKVDLIVTSGTPAVLAVKHATSTIPIVFVGIGDPVGIGVVKSLARPGGNATGISQQATDTSGKRLELLCEAVGGLRRVAVLVNIGNLYTSLEIKEVAVAAGNLGLKVVAVEVQHSTTFDRMQTGSCPTSAMYANPTDTARAGHSPQCFRDPTKAGKEKIFPQRQQDVPNRPCRN
jgi:putative ABC transport system substrate-binding protein